MFIHFLHFPSEIFKMALIHEHQQFQNSQSYIWWPYGEHQLGVRSREEIVRAESIVFQRWDKEPRDVGHFSHNSLQSLKTLGHHSTFSGASVDKIWHQLLWVIVLLFRVLNSNIWKIYFGHYNITGIIYPVQLNMCHLDCTNLLRRVLSSTVSPRAAAGRVQSRLLRPTAAWSGNSNSVWNLLSWLLAIKQNMWLMAFQNIMKIS